MLIFIFKKFHKIFLFLNQRYFFYNPSLASCSLKYLWRKKSSIQKRRSRYMKISNCIPINAHLSLSLLLNGFNRLRLWKLVEINNVTLSTLFEMIARRRFDHTGYYLQGRRFSSSCLGRWVIKTGCLWVACWGEPRQGLTAAYTSRDRRTSWRRKGQKRGGRERMDIRCRHITDLANCHAAFRRTRFQNLFPPALWPSRFFRSMCASSAPVLSPREKLAMLETVVEGAWTALTK